MYYLSLHFAKESQRGDRKEFNKAQGKEWKNKTGNKKEEDLKRT